MQSAPLSWRIAVVVVGAIAGLWTWSTVAEYRAQTSADVIVQSVAGGFLAAVQQANADKAVLAQQRARQQHAARERHQRRVLASNQQCLGGAVVQIDGTTYTQLGSMANPVHCSGSLADRAIR